MARHGVSIGSLAEANFLLREFSWKWHDKAPDGWTYLSSGVSRDAFLAPSNIVYKVGSPYANRADAYHSARCRKMDPLPGWRIPLCHYFGDNKSRSISVMAMEYIQGDFDPACPEYIMNCRYPDCAHTKQKQVQKYYDIADIHCRNYIVEASTGLRVVIDFGESTSD